MLLNKELVLPSSMKTFILTAVLMLFFFIFALNLNLWATPPLCRQQLLTCGPPPPAPTRTDGPPPAPWPPACCRCRRPSSLPPSHGTTCHPAWRCGRRKPRPSWCGEGRPERHDRVEWEVGEVWGALMQLWAAVRAEMWCEGRSPPRLLKQGAPSDRGGEGKRGGPDTQRRLCKVNKTVNNKNTSVCLSACVSCITALRLFASSSVNFNVWLKLLSWSRHWHWASHILGSNNWPKKIPPH